MIHDRQIADPALKMRLEWARALTYALGECHPEDAAAICAAYLESQVTDGPVHDAFGIVYSGAQLWAEAAPIHEIAAYTLAGLNRCKGSPFGIATRKKVLVALWQTLGEHDRHAFLSRVDEQGVFRKGAA